MDIWDGDRWRVLSIPSETATESTELSLLGWMDGVSEPLVRRGEKGRGRREEGVPGLREFLAHGLGRRQGKVLGNIHLTSPPSFRSLPQPNSPYPGTHSPVRTFFSCTFSGKTSLMCVERVMHAHGGPVPWTVYLHGKVLGRQGGWKLAPPAGGCAGPHHGCLSKSRMVISPRFMCHPVPSGRGPLTDAARGQIPACRFWLVPSDTHRQSASSWKLP